MKKGIVISVLALMVLPLLVLAATTPKNVCDIFNIVRVIAQYLLVLLIIFAVIFVIMAAFKYVTASGDAEKVKTANRQILYAVVAIVVGLLAAVTPTIVASVVGGSITDCQAGATIEVTNPS